MNNLIAITFNSSIKPAISKKTLKRIAEITLESLDLPYNIEMGIVITNDREIKELNRTYRNIDSATDVLSFYMQSNVDNILPSDFVNPPDELQHIGEVIISYETALRQAKENGTRIKDELSFLLVHGVLHLMNYNHDNVNDRKVMENKEANIIKLLKKDRE